MYEDTDIQKILEKRIVKKDQGYLRMLLGLIILIALLIIFLWATFSSGTDRNKQFNFVLSSFTLIFIYAAFALSLNLEVGYVGLPNFGKIGFVAIGAYTFVILETTQGSNLFVHVLWSVIATLIFGVLMTLPSLRLKEDYFAIVTIVAGEIVRTIVQNEDKFGGTSGINYVNPIFKKYSADSLVKHIFINFTSFLFLLVIVAITVVIAIFQYRGYLKVNSSKRSMVRTLENADKVFLFFMLIGFIMNFAGIMDDGPSLGLDLMLLLTYFSIKIAKATLNMIVSDNKPTTNNVLVGISPLIIPIISIVVFFLLRFSKGDTVSIISTPKWYTAILSMSIMLIAYEVMNIMDISPLGRTLKAIRDDDTSAVSVGKGLLINRLKGFVVASFVIGFVAPFFVFFNAGVTPETYLPLLTFILYIMIIIGGTANNRGVVFGAVTIELLILTAQRLQSVNNAFIQNLSYPWGQKVDPVNWAYIITGVLLIVFLIFAPEGFFPERKYNNDRYLDDLYLADRDDDIDKSKFLSMLAKASKSSLIYGEPKEEIPSNFFSNLLDQVKNKFKGGSENE